MCMHPTLPKLDSTGNGDQITIYKDSNPFASNISDKTAQFDSLEMM